MEALSCRNCGAALSADAIDRRLAIVSCHHCDAVYDLTSRQRASAPRGPGRDTAIQERAPVPLPPRFHVERDAAGLTIRWRWFRPAVILLVFFAVVWNSLLLVFLATGFLSFGQAGFPAGCLFLVLPLGHVAVGVFVGYAAAAAILNTTEVRADRHVLRVTHRPLPWRPAPEIPSGDIEQLFVTKKVNHGSKGSIVKIALHAITRDDRRIKLLTRFDDVEQALYLEQEIERELDIRDRRVGGEFGGRSPIL